MRTTGKLKQESTFIVDNGPAEQPCCPLVQMCMVCFLKLEIQVSFAEYYSKRNFVERVLAEENRNVPLLLLFVKLTNTYYFGACNLSMKNHTRLYCSLSKIRPPSKIRLPPLENTPTPLFRDKLLQRAIYYLKVHPPY